MHTAQSAVIIIPVIVEARYVLDRVPCVLFCSCVCVFLFIFKFLCCICQCKYVFFSHSNQFGVSVLHSIRVFQFLAPPWHYNGRYGPGNVAKFLYNPKSCGSSCYFLISLIGCSSDWRCDERVSRADRGAFMSGTHPALPFPVTVGLFHASR